LNVTQRADHLAELGINVVQLCPITEFPWDYSAGYNPVTQWAPESYYGNPDDVRAMVDALHTRGIAVTHDIVWNHFSHDDNFLWDYDGTQFYFDDPAVETPWGSQADFKVDGVRRWFIESAHMWLGEYRMDGFRMDATEFMNIYPQEAEGWSLMQWLNNQMDRRWADKINIAEQLPDDSWVTRPTSLGGAGFDSQYYDHFTDRLREEIIEAASGNPQMWVIEDILTGSGTYLSGRYVTNYFELHDEAWPSSGGQRMVKNIDTTAPHDDQWAKGRTKLAQGIVLTAPGIPAMLQGTEWLEDNDFGTDSGNRIDWSHKTTYSGIFDYYVDVIGMRTSTPALRADAAIEVFHVNDSGNVIAFRRTNYSGSDIVVVANFSNTDYANYRIGIPLNEDWVEAVNSQDTKYMGTGTTNPGMITPDAIGQDGYSQSVEIALSKMALVILKPEDCAGIGDAYNPEGNPEGGIRLHAPYPNPMANGTRIAFDLPASATAKIAVHDVTGRLVRVVGGGTFPAGRSEVSWDGTNDRGGRVAVGVYVIRIESGGMEALRKAIVLR
jgi:1,4-alpha-glucan branching enzyme